MIAFTCNLVDALDDLKLVAIVRLELELPGVFPGLGVNGVLWHGREKYQFCLQQEKAPTRHKMEVSVLTRYFPSYLNLLLWALGSQQEPFLLSVLCLCVAVLEVRLGHGDHCIEYGGLSVRKDWLEKIFLKMSKQLKLSHPRDLRTCLVEIITQFVTRHKFNSMNTWTHSTWDNSTTQRPI